MTDVPSTFADYLERRSLRKLHATDVRSGSGPTSDMGQQRAQSALTSSKAQGRQGKHRLPAGDSPPRRAKELRRELGDAGGPIEVEVEYRFASGLR